MAGLSVGVPAILTHTFSVGVFLELLLQSLQWEWTQLLHTDQCRVLVGCCCLPLFQQGIVMLPRAQHHLLDTARIKEEKVWCIGNVGTVSEVPSTDMVSSRLIPIPIQRFNVDSECGFRTFVLRLKYHPTLVWKMFLVPVQPDWKQHPSKRTNIIQPLSWKLWKRVWTVKCFFFAYRKPEQSLRSDHNERLAEVTNHLSPQQVEVLSGSGGVDHSHVHIVSVHTLFFTVAHLSDKRGRVCYHLHFR